MEVVESLERLDGKEGQTNWLEQKTCLFANGILVLTTQRRPH